MKDKPFVDTNVFFYAVDSRNPEKQRRARQLLLSIADQRTGAISSQVALELAANLVRKLDLEPEVVAVRLRVLDAFECVPLNPDVVRSALNLHARLSVSIWDAAILAAAIQAKCRTLYSEDLQHGQVVDGVRIVDPFAA